MFNFFKKKSPIDVLQEQYKKLMKEGYDLSTVDRKASSIKYAEAEKIQEQIAALVKEGKK